MFIAVPIVCLLVPLAAGQLLVGGLSSVSTDREDVQKMAKTAMAELVALKELHADVNGFTVVSAKTQIVSGVNYVLSINFGHVTCNVTLWDRTWMHDTHMTHHVCFRNKRQIFGGVHTVDINSKEIQEMASFALTKMNAMLNEKNTVVTVTSAKTQVVAGIKYILRLSISDGTQKQNCNVTIWDQPWTGMRTITHSHCKSQSKRQLGGIRPGHLSSTIQKAVLFAEDALNAKSNAMYRMVTETVDHITEQLVAGMKYNFHLTLVQSTCMNNDDSAGKSINLCAAANSGQHMSCKVTVLSQPWLKTGYTLLHDSCGHMA